MPEGTRVQINKEEANWVRQIYSWSIEQDMATRKIAKKLNDLGVRTRRGGIWRSTTIRDILSRPLYSGTAYYNRTMSVEPTRRRNIHRYPRQLKSYHKVRPMDQWIAIPVPPIVSEEEQMLARKATQSRRLDSPRKTKYEYLLRRRVVCGECGRKMDCVSMKAKNRDIRYSYYSCKKKEWLFNEEQCRARNVRADWLDDTVWNAMKSWIMEPETLRAELNSVLSIPEQWDSIERQWSDLSSSIRGYEGQISRITDAYQSGAIELDDLKKRRDILIAKISDAVKRRDEIAALRQRAISMESILSDVESFAVTIRNGLETLTFQEKRKLIELLVERVIVKGNNVTVENVVPLKGRFSVLCKDGRGSSQGTEAGRAKAPLPEDA